MMELHELVPSSPKYVFTLYFIFLNALGIVHRHFVGGGGVLLSHPVIIAMFLFPLAAI